MKKTYSRMTLDIIMTALMVVLMNTFITGMLIHEILGIFICLLFFVHKFLNYQWIKAVTLHLFKKSVRTKTRMMYVLDLLLLCGVALTLVSGILISKELFSFSLFRGQSGLLSALHRSAAYTSLILISVHIGLHWQSLMAAFKKMAGITAASRFRTVAARSVTVCIMLLGIKASADKDVIGNISSPFTQKNQTEFGGQTINSYKKRKNQTELSAVSVSMQDTASQTLEEYLSGLNCTACHRHCPLSSPQCGRGEQQAAEAETAYYNENESGSSDASQSAQGKAEETRGGEASGSAAAALGYIPIMGLFIAGTHYTVLVSQLPRYRRVRNDNNSPCS